jgi:hypothetical protein
MNNPPAAAYAVCCIPVSAMRSEPSHRSEMVSQQLFGETCVIIERTRDHWVRIRSRYDGYEGWCQEGHITIIDEGQFHVESGKLMNGWVNDVEFNGRKMMVPLGSSLALLAGGTSNWNHNMVKFDGEIWDGKTAEGTGENIRQLASRFLNTSYLWGGKSVFGIDCSGFSQTVFKFFNYPLPRDAYQQAAAGEVVGFLQEARCGDLAFFDNAEGRITHVGIMLNDQEIIHASVKVRIDKMDNEGIINQDTFERTHQLRIIKRYF